MAEGGGLENRRAKAPWVRILPPPPTRILFASYQMARLSDPQVESCTHFGLFFTVMPDMKTSRYFLGEVAEWSKASAC